MAQLLNGLFGNITGKLGGISYYVGKNKKQYCRICRPIGAKRFATDPQYKYQRKNCREFGRAGIAVKLFRNICREAGYEITDTTCFSRLQSQLMKVIKGDKVNEHGQRNIADGDLSLLKGFQFNKDSRFSCHPDQLEKNCLYKFVGKMMLGIKVSSKNSDWTDPGARCIRIYAMLAAINFETETWSLAKSGCFEGSLSSLEKKKILLQCNLPASNRDPWVGLLGVEFYADDKGTIPVRHGSYHSLQVTGISAF
jgi:hypothetical protein